MSRLVLDLSKAHHPDGIGTWQREIARALVDLGESFGATTLLPTEPGAVRSAIERALDEEAPAGAIEWVDSATAARTEDVLVTSAWVLPANRRGPTLFALHDLTFFEYPELHTLDNRLHCAEGVLRASLDSRVRFVVASQATATVARRWLGPAAEAIHVVANGVAAHWRPIPGARRRIEHRLHLPTDENRGFVLAVGSLEPRKNLGRLTRAHEALSRDLRHRFPLVVVGGGGWRSADLVARLEKDPHVHILRRLDFDTLRDLYTAATVFAYPSLAEGFGLPVLEAMACGAPVVTSDRSSLPEVAGDAAVLVDPTDTAAIRDALADLLTDPDRRRDLAARGSARAALFPWRRTAEDLRALARSVDRTS